MTDDTAKYPPAVPLDSTNSRQHRGQLARATNALLAKVFQDKQALTARIVDLETGAGGAAALVSAEAVVRATADSALAGITTNLQARYNNGLVGNRVFNGSAENGLAGWTVSGSWLAGADEVGPFLFCPSGSSTTVGTYQIISSPIVAFFGEVLSFGLEIYSGALTSAQNLTARFIFLDAGSSIISFSDISIPGGQDWKYYELDNIAVPSGTASAAFEVFFGNAAITVGSPYLAFRHVQVNRGPVAGAYENTNVAQSAFAAVTTESVARASADSALASSISTVSASVGTNTAAISTETSARISADSSIIAQWGVNIDVNGHITGYVHLDGSGATSEFAVRADKFTVYNGSSTVPAFQITGGVAQLNVPLQTNAVATTHIQANAVTSFDQQEVTSGSITITETNPFGAGIPGNRVTVDCDTSTKVLLQFSGSFFRASGTTPFCRFRIYRVDGLSHALLTEARVVDASGGSDGGSSFCASWVDTAPTSGGGLSGGQISYYATCFISSGTSTSATLLSATLWAMAGQR